MLLTTRLTIRLRLALTGCRSVSGLTILLWLGRRRIASRWGWIRHHPRMLRMLRRHHPVLRWWRWHPIWSRRVRCKPCRRRGVPNAVRCHKARDLLRLGRWTLRWLTIRYWLLLLAGLWLGVKSWWKMLGLTILCWEMVHPWWWGLRVRWRRGEAICSWSLVLVLVLVLVLLRAIQVLAGSGLRWRWVY